MCLRTWTDVNSCFDSFNQSIPFCFCELRVNASVLLLYCVKYPSMKDISSYYVLYPIFLYCLAIWRISLLLLLLLHYRLSNPLWPYLLLIKWKAKFEGGKAQILFPQSTNLIGSFLQVHVRKFLSFISSLCVSTCLLAKWISSLFTHKLNK